MTPTVAHLHAPTPGQTVAPRSGSALVTVVRSLAASQIRRGGGAALVERDEVDHGEVDVPLVRAPMPAKVWTTRPEKAFDLAMGAVSGRSPHAASIWRPVLDAASGQGESYVFLHNAPAIVAAAREHPALSPVAYLHNELLRGWPPWRRRRLTTTAPVIAVSDFIARQSFGSRAVEEGRVLPLVNGVDTEAFHPAATEVEPTILYVGKVVPHKGVHLLVAAVKSLAARGLRPRLLIVGGAVLSATDSLSTYETELRQQAVELGDRVQFVPFTPPQRLPDVYREASIMVVPSDWDEPCSLTLPEGMASGLACIASRRGGLPEVGGDAVAYFEPRDLRSLEHQLESLLTDDRHRREMARAARERAVAHDWDRQLDTMVAWIDEWRAGR